MKAEHSHTDVSDFHWMSGLQIICHITCIASSYLHDLYNKFDCI